MYSCLKPQRIYNKYLGEYMYTTCGKCEACRNKRVLELCDRIDREFEKHPDSDALLVTLDYSNACLPTYMRRETADWKRYKSGQMSDVDKHIYERDLSEYRASKYEWVSNRQDYSADEIRLPALPNLLVKEWHHPIKYRTKYAFGHLHYPDAKAWIDAVRAKFLYDFGGRKVRGEYVERSERINNLFGKDLTHEYISFRYFLCGEYGPVTFRPHYHLLLWFSQRYTDEQIAYIREVLSACWSFGRTDIRPVTTRGVDNYLAGYVNSYVGLPEVLRDKSVRPFVTFSKAPCVGAYELDENQVWQYLDTGVVKVTEFDAETAEFKDVRPAHTLFARYFPRCSRFNTETYQYKLRVYSYVYNYFRGLQASRAYRSGDVDISGYYHTSSEVKDLRISQIDWSAFMLYPSEVETTESWRSTMFFDLHTQEQTDRFRDDVTEVLVSEVEWNDRQRRADWTYLDKYASLVCYRYCVMYGLTPAIVLDMFERIYYNVGMDALAAQYLDQQERAIKQILSY